MQAQPLRVSEEDDGFLREVRVFLSQALTPSLRAAGRATTGVHSDIAACREWHRALAGRGWIAPGWPRAHGGTGWTPRQRFLFDRECAENDAPILFASGIRALGPLLIAAGTSAQKSQYLPAILSGENLWCQGFSEAGAGSDLAALSMQAATDGDFYRLSGRKLWTTGAQHANRMFLLARSFRGRKPQEGLTFLLMHMPSPGLTVSPLRTIDGGCEFCEVTFDDVRVPVANRVGADGDGWNIAKLLMRFARANNTTAAHLRRSLRRARKHAAGANIDLAEIETALLAYEAMELSLLSSGQADGGDERASSMLKTQATELNQRISELDLSLAGYEASEDLGLVAKRYFATRAASIYSGTNEIHRNLIARHLLA